MGYNASGVAGEGPEMGPPRPGLENNSAQGQGGFNPYMVGAGIIAGGGAILNYLGGKDANEANSAEGAANRFFAAQEAETARQYDQAKTVWQATHGYQNAVDDMKKAGLNPAMMFKGMAAESGTGGGGSPASAPGNPIHTNVMGGAISSAMQGANLINDIRNSDADIALKQAQAITSSAQATREAASASQLNEETYQLAARRNKNAAEAARDAKQATIDQNLQYNRNLGWFLGQSANLWNSAKSHMLQSDAYQKWLKYKPQIMNDLKQSDLYKKVIP